MRLQACRIVLKYIDILLREEREKVNRFRNFLSDVVRQSDMVLLSLCTVSTLYGMVLIASATHFRGTLKYVAIQGFGLLLGVLLYFFLSSIDVSQVSKKWKWLLAFNFGFILLLRTPFGLTRNGNRAWLGVNDIGAQLGIGFLKNFPITVQPAEIVKITFIILLARQLALLEEKKDLRSFANVIQPTAHAAAMFVFYYVLSKDAGSGLVYLFVFVCMAFAGGFALRWIFLGVGGAVGGFLAAWNLGLLRGDWYDRIKVILDHSYQPEKKGWQQTRGMLALGSGKLTGQGLFNGTQTQSPDKSSLPERQTDFIFCVCQHPHVLVPYAGHWADAAVFQLRRLVHRDDLCRDGGRIRHQKAVAAGVAHQLTFQKWGFFLRESPLLRLTERWQSRLSVKIALRFVPCRP